MVGEALLVGLIGSTLGALLGVLLGQGAVQLVTQTINDLYFVVTVRGVQIPVWSLVKGVVLGVGATLLSAALPAWEAASVPPRAGALPLRSGEQSRTADPPGCPGRPGPGRAGRPAPARPGALAGDQLCGHLCRSWWAAPC